MEPDEWWTLVDRPCRQTWWGPCQEMEDVSGDSSCGYPVSRWRTVADEVWTLPSRYTSSVAVVAPVQDPAVDDPQRPTHRRPSGQPRLCSFSDSYLYGHADRHPHIARSSPDCDLRRRTDRHPHIDPDITCLQTTPLKTARPYQKASCSHS